MSRYNPPPGRGPTMPPVHPDLATRADGKRDLMPARWRRYANGGRAAPIGPSFPGRAEGKADQMPARWRRYARGGK
jgi:hypothetical protein